MQQVRSSLPSQPYKPLLRVKACSSLMLTADKVLAFDCGVPVNRTRVCDRTSSPATTTAERAGKPIGRCQKTSRHAMLGLVMLERFPWPTVSGGNLLDDPGSRSTTAASARVLRLRRCRGNSG